MLHFYRGTLFLAGFESFTLPSSAMLKERQEKGLRWESKSSLQQLFSIQAKETPLLVSGPQLQNPD